MSAAHTASTPAPDASGSASDDAATSGRRAYERELYWASEPAPPIEESIAGLKDAFAELAERLRTDANALQPEIDPGLLAGSPARRRFKQALFRVFRPVGRRYDRMGADIAELSTLLAKRVAALEAATQAMQWSVGAIEAYVRELKTRDAPQLGRGASVPDDYYWHFEGFMRGSSEALDTRLRLYEGRARELLDRHPGRDPALWLDVGCGRGEFASILREWGFRVMGVDISEEAVDACLALGIDAVQGDAVEFLANYSGEPLAAVSGIQIIEHLPRELWLPMIREAHSVLEPGGALLLETINPLNFRALSSSFFADLSHAWPAHPETLRLMAESVGYARVEIDYLNPDEDGLGMDFALWAVKG
jgi:SAM-dependent methyltransferase